MAEVKKTFDVEMLKKALAENPEILAMALQAQGVKGTGVPAYQLLGTEKRDVVFKKTTGTKIVDGDTKAVTFYRFRMLNGSEVSIPEYALADYHIDLKHIPQLDDDGLTNQQKSKILNNGAF